MDRQYGHPVRFNMLDAQDVRPLLVFFGYKVGDSCIDRIALWERRRLIMGVLGTLCAVHWGLLYRGMFVVIAQWDDVQHTCVVVETSPVFLNITFFFSTPIVLCVPRLLADLIYAAMGFDFIILVFTTVALLERQAAKTGLWKLIFQDGLVYFLVSFTMNAIPAVRLHVTDLPAPLTMVYHSGVQLAKFEQ